MRSLYKLVCLVIVLAYSQAQDPPACGPILGPEDLHQVEGLWALVGVVYDKVKSQGREIPRTTSSHVEAYVRPDNRSIVVYEHNTVGGHCVSFIYELTVPQTNTSVPGLDMFRNEMFVDGQLVNVDDRNTVQIFGGSKNTMILLLKGQNQENILARYRRVGQHHQDLQTDREQHIALAQCLGLSGGDFEVWHYDGSAEFCLKKNCAKTVGPEELYQVDGSWALVGLVYDKVISQGRQIPLVSSSLIKSHVLPDNRTIEVQEQSVVGGRCVSFSYNVTFPLTNVGVHHLDMHKTEVYIDGRQVPINEKASIQIFLNSGNTKTLLLTGRDNEALLATYRREGQHQQDLQSAHELQRVLAQCLGLTGGNFAVWQYDGQTEFCSKSS